MLNKKKVKKEKSLSTMCRELDELLSTRANILDRKSVNLFWKKGNKVL